MHIIGLAACLLIIAVCFLPWTHYPAMNETFTGYYVKRFPGGIYYGRAGRIITIIAGLIFLLMWVPKMWAKKTNLFLAALLVAFSIRTYFLFTTAVIPGEVVKKAGIYLIIPLSVIILISSVFPKGGSKVQK